MNKESTEQMSLPAFGGFDENNFIRLLFRARRLQDLQQRYTRKLLQLLPVPEEFATFPSSFYLTATNFAKILERYYPGSVKQKNTTKFTIPLLELYHYLRISFEQEAQPVAGIIRFIRTYEADKIIGVNSSGEPTNIMTVISDSEGRILSAYPGISNPQTHVV